MSETERTRKGPTPGKRTRRTTHTYRAVNNGVSIHIEYAKRHKPYLANALLRSELRRVRSETLSQGCTRTHGESATAAKTVAASQSIKRLVKEAWLSKQRVIRPLLSARVQDRLCAEGFFHRADNPAASVASVALAFANLSLGFSTSICRERTAHLHFGFELALFISADIAPITLVRLDRSSFTGFSGFAWHNHLSDERALADG
jgi:hypothetical protein